MAEPNMKSPARRAVAIREQTLGPDHPEVAASVAALAALVDGQGRLNEAEALFCDSYGVDLIIPSATSAVREARNGPQFVERVKQEVGLTLRVLDGEREAFTVGGIDSCYRQMATV